MERALLEGYGLNKEQIDTIMAEHGKTVNAAREGMTALQEQVNTQTAQLQRYADYDAIVTERDELRASSTANAEELAQLRDYKDRREYGDRMTVALGEKQFVNDVTKDHVFNAFVTAAKSAENEGKTDSEIFQSVVGGHEAEYFKTKFGVKMPPVHQATGAVDVKAVQDAKYANNPFYKP